MKNLSLVLLLLPMCYLAQKKPDVVANIEAKMAILKPIGNNSLAQDLKTFYGFSLGGNLMTPVNFGVGADFSMLYSNVQYGKRNTYGNVGSPRLSMVNVFLTHRENISEEFLIEELAGLSYTEQKNFFVDGNQLLKNSGFGLLLGGKAIYILDPEAYQAVFVEARFQTFRTNIYNENSEIQKYYDRSYFLTLNLGYRFNF